MTKKFIFTSDHFGVSEIPSECEIELSVTAYDECDGEFEIESIFDKTCKVFRELSDFPESERQSIEFTCQEIADENAWEANQDRIAARAEDAFDASKDGSYD